MNKLVCVAICGLLAAALSAGVPATERRPTPTAVNPNAPAGSATTRDWGDPVVWDNLTPADPYGGGSWIDNDGVTDMETADDFPALGSAVITEIEFMGWSSRGTQYIDQFRITFWTQVPETGQDEGHPGDLLY